MKGYDETHVFKSFAKQKTYLEMEHTVHTWQVGFPGQKESTHAEKSDHIHIHIYNIFDGLDLFSRPIQNYT